MLNIQLARKYGMAIFEIAQDEKQLEKYGKELSEVSQAVFSQAELKDFLTNPQIQPQDKKDVLLKLLKTEVSPLMMNFLLLLVDKRRMGLLEAINDCYQELSNKAQGIIIADVTTAYDLKAELQARLSSRLEDITGKKVSLRTHNDKSIIGGIVVKIGDTRIDGSVTGRLQALKAELMASN
ncbi:ATP synthase F1 subunit delta [Anaerovibrio sp.]|uniref:ATP synthase F1 subunit delta n=1 Tax=Anaerovibrio sp. TaxID=1872532 RepID=UPI003F1877DF